MKIHSRDYDIEPKEAKGADRLTKEELDSINNCKLTKQIVVLDKSRYFINSDGEPEMTKEAQEEYDDFISGLREMLLSEKIRIIDEGFGEGEDELDWHITGCAIVPELDNKIAGIVEVDTCVMTDDEEEDDND